MRLLPDAYLSSIYAAQLVAQDFTLSFDAAPSSSGPAGSPSALGGPLSPSCVGAGAREMAEAGDSDITGAEPHWLQGYGQDKGVISQQAVGREEWSCM